MFNSETASEDAIIKVRTSEIQKNDGQVLEDGSISGFEDARDFNDYSIQENSIR